MTDELRAKLQKAADDTLAKYGRLINDPAGEIPNWKHYGDPDYCLFCLVTVVPSSSGCSDCPLEPHGDEAGCSDIDMRHVVYDKNILPAAIIAAATARRAFLVKRLAAAGYCEVER